MRIDLRSKDLIKKQYSAIRIIQDRMKMMSQCAVKRGKFGLEYYKFKGNEMVLDIGCGAGSNSLRIASALGNNGRLFSIDTSKAMVQMTRKLLKKNQLSGTVSIGNCESMDFEDGMFDLVIAFYILYHLDLKKALAEISRVLKDQGVFIATTVSQGTHDKWYDEFTRMISLDGIGRKLRCYKISFSLESGKDILSRYFNRVERHVSYDSVRFTSIKIFMQYIKEAPVLAKIKEDNQQVFEIIVNSLTKQVNTKIQKKGYFELKNPQVTFIASKKKT